ncbi:YheC/YheD family protein [Paenibacillus validus]|uniref:YheC/YheD family endospore coat-associated protein n=1 Tax=Paenibacillus validus TaxID=44253 RepID=UPI000FDAEE8E|nr:YheC/YheD family protein [Paenibacillus validus]MED4602256.1 YheC/YheD family protein [Paenibacillus validus]MED4607202.1 YheC/YheD family protein [Paenibacillus validus]
MYPPYVGILVNDNELRKIPLGTWKYEAIEHYEEAGKKYGFTPCFFRICDLRAGQKKVKAYVKQLEGYVRRKIPAPLVIHNRAIYLSKSQDRRLSSWVRDGRQLFNRWNRYGKLRIHQLMLENPSLHPHLPATRRATPDGIARLMKRFDSLIIKPNNSSIGRGVMRMDRTPTGWKLSYPISFGPVNQKWRTVRWKGTRLPAVLRSRLRKETYIVQQRLPLATFQGSPFDLRVSVQRTADGSWDVTGIVAKVASKHTFVTNVAQGGTTYQLPLILQEEYAHLDPEEVVQRIYNFSILVASHLSDRLPHLADLGLDVGITTDGYPLFIECNGKDQRYSFREAGMLSEWIATYDNPMAYAKYLLDGCSGHV